MLYFEDANLLATMSKLRAVMDGPHPADRLHVETLSLLACLEMSGVFNAQNGRDVVHAGQLSLRARDRVRTYIEHHLSGRHLACRDGKAGRAEQVPFHPRVQNYIWLVAVQVCDVLPDRAGKAPFVANHRSDQGYR